MDGSGRINPICRFGFIKTAACNIMALQADENNHKPQGGSPLPVGPIVPEILFLLIIYWSFWRDSYFHQRAVLIVYF